MHVSSSYDLPLLALPFQLSQLRQYLNNFTKPLRVATKTTPKITSDCIYTQFGEVIPKGSHWINFKEHCTVAVFEG